MIWSMLGRSFGVVLRWTSAKLPCLSRMKSPPCYEIRRIRKEERLDNQFGEKKKDFVQKIKLAAANLILI